MGFVIGLAMEFDQSNLIGFVIRKGNGSNNSLFLSCQMGLSDGAFLMIKHTPCPNGNHPISSPICPMGVADMLEQLLPERIYNSQKYPYVLIYLKHGLIS